MRLPGERASRIKRSLAQHTAIIIFMIVALFCVFMLYLIEFFNVLINPTWKATIASIASTLLAASFISGSFELYFRDKFSDALDIQIAETIKNELAVFNTSQRAGIRNVYNNLEEAMTKLDLYSRIPNEAEIMILQTWAPTLDALKAPMRAMQIKGGKAMVLCLKEGCDVARIRSTFLDNFAFEKDEEEIRKEQFESANNDIKKTKRAVMEIFGESSIRQYDIFPTFSLYIIGNVILMGHFLIHKNSFASMQIEVAKDSAYGKELLEYFHKLWSISK